MHIQGALKRLNEINNIINNNSNKEESIRVFLGLNKNECVWPEPLKWFAHFYTQFEAVAKDLKDAKVRLYCYLIHYTYLYVFTRSKRCILMYFDVF